MTDKKKQKNNKAKDFLKALGARFDKDPLKALRTPYRDWMVVVVVAAVLFFVSLAAHILLFQRIEDQVIFNTVDEREEVRFEMLEVQKLKNVVSAFEEKQKAFNELIERPVPDIDPAR